MPVFHVTWLETVEVVADSREEVQRRLDEGESFDIIHEQFGIELVPDRKEK